MSDIKFSCPECGQHITCGEPWAGHEIDCPACHSKLVVPRSERAPAAVGQPVAEASKAAAPRLASGATQVRPAKPHTPAVPQRKFKMTAPSENYVLKYSVIVVIIAALGWAGYFYGLPLIKNSLGEPNATTPGTSASSPTGARRGGPMGELNDAMDASETLDSGSGSRARAPTATNTNANRAQPASSGR